MSAHRDRTLRIQLALDDAAQVAALTALYGGDAESAHADVTSSQPGTHETASGTFVPHDGTLTTSPKGGLSWKLTPWPTSVINSAQSDAIHVCIDHSELAPHCPRSPQKIARLHDTLDRWRHVRGIYTVRGYGTPDTWSVATLALVLQDVLRAVPSIHPGVTPETDAAIVRASAFPRRGNEPSQFRITAEAGLQGDDSGLLSCRMYFALDAAACVHDWIAQYPCFYSSNYSEDATLARAIRLKRATNGPHEPSRVGSDSTHTEEDEDDDGEDLVSRVFLHTIRQYLAPDATWDRIGYLIRLMRTAVEGAYGRRP